MLLFFRLSLSLQFFCFLLCLDDFLPALASFDFSLLIKLDAREARSHGGGGVGLEVNVSYLLFSSSFFVFLSLATFAEP